MVLSKVVRQSQSSSISGFISRKADYIIGSTAKCAKYRQVLDHARFGDKSTKSRYCQNIVLLCQGIGEDMESYADLVALIQCLG